MSPVRFFTIFLKVAISGGLLWYVLRQVDFREIATRLGQADWPPFVWALCLILVLALAEGSRWVLIMRRIGYRLPWKQAFFVTLSCGFFNRVLVTLSGVVYRGWWARRNGVPLGAASSGALLDRAVGVMALAIMVAGGLPWLWHLDQGGAVAWLATTLVLVSLVGFFTLAMLCRLPARWFERPLLSQLRRLSTDLALLIVPDSNAAALAALAVLIPTSISLSVACIAQGLGIAIDLRSIFIFLPAVTLLAALPISIGGWGIREGAMVVAFAMVGVGKSDAVLVSITLGVLHTAFYSIGGVCWLLGYPKR